MPPNQNPDKFIQLNNVLPPITETFQRRWGTSSFDPKLDSGANVNDDKGSTVFTFPASNLFSYENQVANTRTLIGAASDGSGNPSSANAVKYFDVTGVPQLIFTPSLNAKAARMAYSRSYAYFVDTIAADQKSWNIVAGTQNFGIVAPATPVLLAPIQGGGATVFQVTSAAANSGGNTVYTGQNLSGLGAGIIVTVQGFVNVANNGTFTVVSSTNTTVTLNNAAGVAETPTNPATITSTNVISPTSTLNGWGTNAHVGMFEGGTSQSHVFAIGPTSGTVTGYTNPNNAVDGNTATFAHANGSHTHTYFGSVWTFPATTTSLNSLQINVLSSVPTLNDNGAANTGRSAGIFYSFDGGTTWLTLYDVAQRNQKWDAIQVPTGTTISNIQVMAFMDSHDDMTHNVYEVNLQGFAAGSGTINLITPTGRQYFQIFGNTTKQHFSDLSPVSTGTGPISGGAVPLTNIAVSSDPQVNIVVLLATADGGDQTTLYFVGQVQNGVTTFTDTLSEPNLILGNIYQQTDVNGDDIGVVGNKIPPNGLFPTIHKGRMFMANGQFLSYSKSVNEVTTSTGIIAGRYEECWPPTNQIDTSPGAENIRGLLSDGYSLYIGTERHVRRLLGDSAVDFNIPNVLFAEAGVLNQNVWQIVFTEGTPIGAMWLTPDFRILESDFNTYRDVGVDVQGTLNRINPANAQNCWAQFVGYGPYNFYVLAVVTDGNTTPDTMLVYDLHRHQWYTFTFPFNALSAIFYVSLSGIPRWLVVDPAGNFYFIDQTQVMDTKSASSIVSTLQTSWLDLTDSQSRKTLNEIGLTTIDPNILVTVEGASSDADFVAPTIVINQASPFQNIFGDLKVYLTTLPTRFKFYRITFQSTSNPVTSTVNDTILGEMSAEFIPYRRA